MSPVLVVAALISTAPPCASGNIRVDWVRADGAGTCPDGHRVAEAITERLGCAAFGDEPSVRFEVLVAKAQVGWAAHIETHDRRGSLLGRRVLESRKESCDVLSDAVALTVALMAENLAVDTSTSSSSPPPPAIEPVAARVVFVPAGTASATVAVAEPPGTAGEGIVSGVVNAGTLPSMQPGVQVATAWRPGSWSAAVGLLAVPVSRGDDELGFGLFASWAEGCASAVRTDRVVVDLCGRVLAGLFSVVVYGDGSLDVVEPGSFSWVAVAPLARATVRVVGPLFASIEAAPVVSLLGRRFDVLDGSAPEAVHEEAVVAFHGGIGLGLRFE